MILAEIDKLITRYSVRIKYIETDDDSYYMAYSPEFGAQACSATGESREEAVEYLTGVMKAVIRSVYMRGKELPEPDQVLPL